jgi:hypothetical protein
LRRSKKQKRRGRCLRRSTKQKRRGTEAVEEEKERENQNKQNCCPFNVIPFLYCSEKH